MLLRNTLFFLLIAGIGISCQSASDGGNTSSDPTVTRFDHGYQFEADQLEPNIRGAVAYLEKHVQPNGRFHYLTNLNPEAEIDPAEYNILRHCGTLYAMGQAAELYPDAVDKETMVRAADYIRKNCLSPLPGADRPNLGVWTEPEITKSQWGRELKLGGTGLGILGFLAVERQVPGYMNTDTLALLAESILAMQRPNGRFEAIYEARQGQFSDHISAFYPGEAILALLQLYQMDEKERWLEAALNGLKFIVNARKEVDIFDLPADHWILLATNELFAGIPEEKYAGDHAAILDQGRRIAQKMVNTSKQNPSDSLYFGAFNSSGSTTSLGTRLEGLVSFGVHLDEAEDAALIADLKQAVHFGLGYVQEARVRQGPLQGGVTRLPEHLRKLKPNPVNSQIQIDNVQHVMSGWIWAKRRQDWLWGR
jgi:hypothetical protein